MDTVLILEGYFQLRRITLMRFPTSLNFHCRLGAVGGDTGGGTGAFTCSYPNHSCKLQMIKLSNSTLPLPGGLTKFCQLVIFGKMGPERKMTFFITQEVRWSRVGLLAGGL